VLKVSKKENTIKSIEENRKYHRNFFLAINNPLRRRILRAIQDGYTTIDALQSITNLEIKILEWHLSYLEHCLCIERKNLNGTQEYKLTQEGEIINYLEK
jgi:DNA-binding transcriptional ArsR family regulator